MNAKDRVHHFAHAMPDLLLLSLADANGGGEVGRHHPLINPYMRFIANTTTQLACDVEEYRDQRH